MRLLPILRALFIITGALLVLISLYGIATDELIPSLSFFLWGIGFIACGLIENWRYRPNNSSSGASNNEWVKTDESFINPDTDTKYIVFYNPKTGDRKYEPKKPENDYF